LYVCPMLFIIPCTRRRFSIRETLALVFPKSLVRRFLFWKPLIVEFSAKEGDYVFGLDGVDSRACQVGVNCLQLCLAFKHNIGGIFGLHDAPMIAKLKVPDDRAIALCHGIQPCVYPLHLQAVGCYPSISKTIDAHKGVINECVVDLMLSKSRSQPMAAIDRLVHHSVILELNLSSYRLEQSKRDKAS